ncbi:uncharacterized protein LOC133519626 isoform X1 [Cydia pomonella]|uniref:uncharacterized protein LOC133519626 isoform X1 n=1 Tax=Cydia pomonella TaxID=82600 RepID=UPI002ADD50AE|nr:uncharacterized protein LOC133519626 isoform X1 [Cydia pomonella]
MEIHKLIVMGAITQCQPSKDQFLSSIFTIPKKDGSHRFILNLKCLNNFIITKHFKLEDVRTLCKLVTTDDYMCTIDLKHAYYLVPINESHKKYLRFTFNKKIYEFNCMPFGLSTAPLVFTKLLKPAIETLREQGIRIIIYLDDIICLGSTYKECLNNTQTTCNLLQCLGFIINEEKSSITPSQVKEYLGFTINSRNMTLSPTLKKRNNLYSLIKNFLKIKSCSIREFAKLLGNLVSVCIAIPYGFVYTKKLERERFLALECHNYNFEGIMIMNKPIKTDLMWWKENILVKSSHIKQYNFSLEIFSDASLMGWGAFCNGQSAQGNWSEWERNQHINYLELLAAFFALRCFADKYNDCEVLLRIDNTTAIAYINRMGGVQYPLLNDITRQIWRWCEARNLWIFASYIKSKENVEADFQSRNFNVDTEWELAEDIFNIIVNKFGAPDLDLFASRINHKCDKYISWHRDPFAWNIDAFTVKWNSTFFYAFPPFGILLKVLHKIKSEKATGILVFPLWPSQVWYPLLKSMVISDILTFGPSEDLLMSPFRTPHPLQTQLILAACKLSGKRLKED